MNKTDHILSVICELIDDTTVKCSATRDIYVLADLMRTRMAMEDYIGRYGSEEPEAVPWDIEQLENEIHDAAMYYDKWRETGYEPFREVAEGELSHAEVLLTFATNIPADKVAVFTKKIQTIKAGLRPGPKALPQPTPTPTPAPQPMPPVTPPPAAAAAPATTYRGG